MPCPTVTPVRSCNPRRKKVWTYEQAASRKEKAENFTRDVLEDDERADELEAMSVEDYAKERGVDLVQGDSSMITRKKNGARSTSQASTGESRENPAVAALQTATKALDQQNKLQARVRELEDEVADRDRLLDSIVDILDDDDSDFKASDKIAAIEELFPEDDGEGED
jgi:pyruvate/2-oxoglutarate dehydrogenase complex dihydrolipoamide acyltransferase (E2) component